VCVCVCLVCTQDDLWGNCAKKIKLDPTASQNDGAGSGSAAAVVPPADPNNVSATESGIRRSARNRRPRGELIVVSSNDTLLDLKMKVSFFRSSVCRPVRAVVVASVTRLGFDIALAVFLKKKKHAL